MLVQKKILYVDMDNVLVDFKSGIDQLDEITKLQYADRLDEVPHIFNKMKPMVNAIDSYNELSEHFDIYILSTSPWENSTAWVDKLHWVKEHLGLKAYKRLILTHHKNLNSGDFLIDDRKNNGAENFKGEWLHFGTEKFPDWLSVKAYLFERV